MATVSSHVAGIATGPSQGPACFPHEGDEVREQLIGSAVPDRLERLQRRPRSSHGILDEALRGHGTQRSEETDSDRVGRRRPVEVRRPAQQRHFECLELGSRQVLELVGADAVGHVDERTEDETCLGVARASRQSTRSPAARASSTPASQSVVLPMPGQPVRTSVA